MDEAPDGSLWFGTTGGVVHYDGTTLTKIPFDADLLSRITHSKPVPWATSLMVLPDGNLLVLIGESLVLRTDKGWRVMIFDTGLTRLGEVTMKRSADGSIWFMTPGELWHISPDLTECSKVMMIDGEQKLMSFCFDTSGDLWVSEQTAKTLIQLIHLSLKSGRIGAERQRLDMPFVYEQGEVNLASRRNGTLVVGTRQRTELLLFDPRSGQWTKMGTDKTMMTNYSLGDGRDGSVWVGSDGRISRLTHEGKLLEYPDLAHDLHGVPCRLFEASDNRLWIIGLVGQVCSVDLGSARWTTYVGLNFMCETDQGVQWFTPGDRKSVIAHDLNSGTWCRYDQNDGLIGKVMLMLTSSQGLVWAAGQQGDSAAIAVFDPARQAAAKRPFWTQPECPPFAFAIMPNAAFEAADGTVWFGAQGRRLTNVPDAGGAVQYRVNEDRSVKLLKHHSPPGFPYYITAMAQTPDRTLWFGSTVVFSTDEAGASVRTFPEILGDNAVAMTLDRDQSLWVAKEYFGVCRWKGNVWEVFTKNEGLADLKFCDLLALPDGSVLAASSEGIGRFDGVSWITDVFPENFHMSSRWSSLERSADGSIWFSYLADKNMQKIVTASGGFCAVRYRPETAPPDTVISDCLERVSQPGNTHVKWSASDTWANTPTESLQYSWRMDEGEWSPFSYETGRTFLNVHSGSHVLEVRSRDRDFNVDPTPARVEFTVTPPVWKQAWFIVLVLLFIASTLFLIWLMFRNRERYLLKQQQDREAFLLKEREEREAHLKEVHQIKTLFFTNMSHEIRTPLNAVLGMATLLAESELSDEQRDFVEVIQTSGEILLTVINDILDLSKIEAGALQLEAVPFNLRQCVVRSLDMVSKKAFEKGLELACSVDGKVPRVFIGDSTRLRQVLLNLVNNAIKFTSTGEVVVRINGKPGPDQRYRLEFSVTDTGIGMPPEATQRIFNPFQQADASTTRKYGGTGLGLSICNKLVELMDGSIQVKSAVGKGSEFSFTIVLRVADDAPVQENIHIDVLKGKRILVVDDNQTSLQILERQLQEWGAIPLAFRSGSEALKHLGSPGSIALAILDMTMPEMDGEVLAGELRNRSEFMDRPILILRSPGNISVVDNPLANVWLTKPVKPERLLEKLTQLLNAPAKAQLPGPAQPEQPLNHAMGLEHPLRILVAEDNTVNQKVALKLLSRLGYEADMVSNGLEAVQAVQQKTYDLVLMDIQMPEMDGLEATRKILELYPDGNCPKIVAMTAHALEESRHEGMDSGMSGYVVKPIRLEALADALKNTPRRKE